MSVDAAGFEVWMRAHQVLAERALEQVLPAAGHAPARLHAAMRYAASGGGKRVRPLLAFAAAQVVQAPVDRAALAGAAVELIHAYSLVHDDMPCMDDDTLRRGKPTVHVQYDLASVGRTLDVTELEFMHVHKTGALIRCATLLGALCGRPLEAAERAHLDRFAKAIGLAFQVVDDLLDAEASTATLGKTAGKDAEANKPTYVTALGLRAAKEWARDLRAQADDALAPLGPGAARLGQLADFIVKRHC